jgi:hypothetical protein
MSTTAIQEALLCPFLFEDTFRLAIVLRRGRDCVLLTVLQGLEAGIAGSHDGVQVVQDVLRIPCRVLDGQEGALLARKTIVAEHEGTGFYRL